MPYADPEKKRAHDAAYNAAYRAAHREKILAYNAAYRAAHREARLAYNRAYDAAHREARLARSRAYYAAHREEELAYSAAYRDAHRDHDMNLNKHRLGQDIDNGTVLIGSDAHIWPKEFIGRMPALEAFREFASLVQPDVIVMNGDVFDGAKISRHADIGWEKKPTPAEELEACQEWLAAIQEASPESRRIWALGNHDMRFETKIAGAVPELAKVKGVHLKDHFPEWEPCWSFWVNDNVCIKHRYKGGVNAIRNNTLYAGVSMVTGHLHALNVTRFSDYKGPRWGVDTGTLANLYGPQFTNYTEDNPVDWASGFAFLTFQNGELLWPEVIHVDTQRAQYTFQGKVYTL